jgi:hypothetical protein
MKAWAKHKSTTAKEKPGFGEVIRHDPVSFLAHLAAARRTPGLSSLVEDFYPVKAGQSRVNPAKPGQKPGLRRLVTGSGPALERVSEMGFVSRHRREYASIFAILTLIYRDSV